MKNKLFYALPILTILFVLTGCTKLPISGGLYPIDYNNKYGFIDNKGVEIVETKYDAVIPSDENLIAVKFQGKWGYINRQGEFVIIPQYTKANAFKDGLAYVSDGKIEGYINEKGKFVWKKEGKNNSQPAAQAQAKPQKKMHLSDQILKEVEDVLP